MGLLGNLFRSYSENPDPERMADVMQFAHEYYWELCKNYADLSDGQRVFLACYLAYKQIGYIGKLLAPTIKMAEAAAWGSDGRPNNIDAASAVCGMDAGHVLKRMSQRDMIELINEVTTDVLPGVKKDYDSRGLSPECVATYNTYVKYDEAGMRQLLSQLRYR